MIATSRDTLAPVFGMDERKLERLLTHNELETMLCNYDSHAHTYTPMTVRFVIRGSSPEVEVRHTDVNVMEYVLSRNMAEVAYSANRLGYDVNLPVKFYEPITIVHEEKDIAA